MTRRHFMIRLVTNIFKSFKVRINVMANYSEDLSSTHFKAKVVFIGGLAKVSQVVIHQSRKYRDMSHTQ